MYVCVNYYLHTVIADIYACIDFCKSEKMKSCILCDILIIIFALCIFLCIFEKCELRESMYSVNMPTFGIYYMYHIIYISLYMYKMRNIDRSL